MLKNIAVDGMTLITNPSTVVATIVLIDVPSIRLKADGKSVYLDGAQVTVTAITNPPAGATVPDPGPYTVPLNSSAIRPKSEGSLVLLEGDESDTINASPTTPVPVVVPTAFTIEILSAGQTRSKAQ